jgi:RimJ/RimL family protein N-acetyltransferase
MRLEGLLVDLVPYGDDFKKMEHRWNNSEAVFWASVGDRGLVSKASIERRQQERAERAESGPHHSVWFGIRTKDGQPIGDMALNWVLPHHRLSMLGAMIGEPDYWGGGYGTDALLLIVDYAFNWLDFHKLWLATMAPNIRAQRNVEKVGFKLEARRREAIHADGEWVDDLLYGLLREEWPGREAMIARLGLKARKDS